MLTKNLNSIFEVIKADDQGYGRDDLIEAISDVFIGKPGFLKSIHIMLTTQSEKEP